MTVRPAAAGDAPAIAARDARGFGSDARAGLIRSAVAEGRCHMAEQDGAPVGFAMMHRRFFGQAFIELLWVDSAYRRRGIGAALIEACKDTCGGDKLFTSTNRSNRPMQALLARTGFTICGFIDGLDEGDPELIYCLKGNCSSDTYQDQ